MDSLLAKCKSQWKTTFIGTFIIGFITYFYFMTNHFLTYDSMWNLYSEQDMISSGRQFLTYACGISSYYDLPALNGMLAIFYLSLTAVFLVEIFDVKSKVFGILLGAFIVTFPSVASTFAYSFTVDGYMLAILITTIAFYITNRYKFGFVVGIILAGIGIGIYQAYYAYLIVLCIIKLLLDLIDETNVKPILSRIWRYLVMGAGGYIFYAISLKCMLMSKSVDLSGYQGTEKVLSFSLKEIPQGLKTAFYSFYKFVTEGNVLAATEPMKYAFMILALVGVGCYVIRFIEKKRYKEVIRIAMAVILLATIPFALNIICILSPSTYMHLLIRYGWVLLFVLVIVLVDRLELSKKSDKLKKAIGIVVAVASVVMVFQFALVSNIAAYNMEERYEKTYALCVRLIDRLEQTPGYKTGDAVAILGGFPNQENYPHTSITEKQLSGYFGIDGEYVVNSTAKYAEFCAHYLNVTLQLVSQEKEIELTTTEAYQDMECFPSKDCIEQIDGVWVIKLNG